MWPGRLGAKPVRSPRARSPRPPGVLLLLSPLWPVARRRGSRRGQRRASPRARSKRGAAGRRSAGRAGAAAPRRGLRGRRSLPGGSVRRFSACLLRGAAPPPCPSPPRSVPGNCDSSYHVTRRRHIAPPRRPVVRAHRMEDQASRLHAPAHKPARGALGGRCRGRPARARFLRQPRGIPARVARPALDYGVCCPAPRAPGPSAQRLPVTREKAPEKCPDEAISCPVPTTNHPR